MSFLARWLNLAKDRRPIGLRPHRDVDVDAAFNDAYDRVREAVERVLGAHIAVDDRAGGIIEAAFGLVHNERVRCSLQSLDDIRTRVHVEAFFPAGTSVRQHSNAVNALADVLDGKFQRS